MRQRQLGETNETEKCRLWCALTMETIVGLKGLRVLHLHLHGILILHRKLTMEGVKVQRSLYCVRQQGMERFALVLDRTHHRHPRHHPRCHHFRMAAEHGMLSATPPQLAPRATRAASWRLLIGVVVLDPRLYAVLT